MLLGTVFFNSKMAKFIFLKKEGKSLCGGSHRFDKFDLKQAVDRASTGYPILPWRPPRLRRPARQPRAVARWGSAVQAPQACFCRDSCCCALSVVAAAMASEGSVSEGSKLKSAQLLELVKAHLATDAGKELQQKIGFTYQINIAPKVL